jgi:hypothetical protein
MRKKQADNPSNIPNYTPEQKEEYEELLLKREQLYKEAKSIKISYVQEFGELTVMIFQAKLDCIRLKKTIAYCQKAINNGEKIDIDAMQGKVDEEMTLYKIELEEMLVENARAKEAKTSDTYSMEMTKRLYRKLAKLLHPDINAKTEQYYVLQNLWNQVLEAYATNNFEKLEELEVLVNKAMKELGDEGFELKIEDIEKKLERVRKQIEEIITTKPYTYHTLLDDPNAIEDKKAELNKELEEYNEYKATLEETLNNMLEEEGGVMTWQMTL